MTATARTTGVETGERITSARGSNCADGLFSRARHDRPGLLVCIEHRLATIRTM